MLKKFLILLIIFIILIHSFIVNTNSIVIELEDCENIENPIKKSLLANANKLLLNTSRIFTENRGQLNIDEVRFYVQGGGLWFTDDGMWFEIRKYVENRGRGDENQLNTRARFEPPEPIKYRRVIIKQEFVGANRVRPEGKERLSWNSNFFYGNDSSKWHTEVPNYREVYYEDLYNGIDLRYYTNEKGLKYDFIVHPSADPEQIRIKWEGTNGLKIIDSKNLVIKTPIEDIIDGELFIYQDYDDVRYQVDGRFVKYSNYEYGIKILRNYCNQEILIIDPLIYSTYIGGNNWEVGRKIVLDSNDNAFITGSTSSVDFPNTTGVFNQTINGEQDIFVLKLNQDGSALYYSTYIGGVDDDSGYSMSLDSIGNAYVTGVTQSLDFPLTTDAYDITYNGGHYDVFVLKLNQTGSALNYSTYVGGNNWDMGEDIKVDTLGNIYIGGYTTSVNFPNTTDAFDTTFEGESDSFVFKLNWNGSKLLYSTYIGGSESEYDSYWSSRIDIDSFGNVFITGCTNSSDFPTTKGAYNTTFNGNFDVFVLKLNWNGSRALYSTLVGGSNYDQGTDIAIDSIGNAFITGFTNSSNFPTTPEANDTLYNVEYDVFVLKLNQNGSVLLYSTYIGGSNRELSDGIVIDLGGCAYVTGQTLSSDFPVTSDANDKTHNNGIDCFIFRINPTGSELMYSTFMGGSGINQGRSITVDLKFNAYITGDTDSLDFYTTPGALSSLNNGGYDIFTVKISFPPFLLINISSTSLLRNNTPIDMVYSRLCQYTFRVNIIDTVNISDLDNVLLTLDPYGSHIQIFWDSSTGQFSELSDLNNYIFLDSSSNYINNGYFWKIDFNVIFNWNYPDEDFHGIRVQATSLTLPTAWFNATKFYRVENDVVFNGTLNVFGEDNRTILNGELVRGGEKFIWTGLTPVYENTTNLYLPDDIIDITLWDENGKMWLNSPREGEQLHIENFIPTISHSKNYTFIINLTGIPPECDKTNESFSIKIDGDNVTFSDQIPDNITWQRESAVKASITITDHGGGVVNGSSVMRCLSTDNGSTWSDWENISGLKSKVCITPQDVVLLTEGRNNLIKWRAKDSVGHGPVESDEYRILVDTVNVTFSNPIPEIDHESITEKVSVGITISDNTSGVDASTISYSISTDSGVFWSYWTPVIGYKNGTKINITLNLTFPNGTANRIRWRAADIAGNGFTISKEYLVIVNTWLQTFIPRVRLLSPMNNAIIPTQLVKLSWMLENKNLEGVTYDVYFNTVYPPNATRAKGIMNTSFLIDDLADGETYYWTVIPKLGDDVGWCVSGIWSFTVNTSVPFPTVILTHPKNGSIIPSPLPTLVWSVEFEGTEKVTFDIYLSSNKDPGIEATSYQKTYYLPETDLEDNTTYYWKIIPMAGDIQGPDSEIWSFMIKRDYIPRFGLNLTLEPAVVELEAAEMTYVKAIVKNLGELNDTISLSIQIPNDVNIGAIVNEPVAIDTASEGIAVFNITIITPQDIKKGEIDLIVVAVSEIAPEYGLSIEENAVLKIIILGADKTGTDKSFSEIWIIFIIIVILIIVVLLFILLIKRRKRSDHEPPPAETVTVKPIVAPTPDKLKGETTAKPTLAQPAQGPTTPTPQLASPKTVGQAPAPKQIPQVTQKPQLPPSQTIESKVEEKSFVPTLATAPSTSTVTIQTNQQIGKEKEGGKTE